MKKTLIYIISVIGLFSCDLDEVPVSEVSKEPVFSTENGLELYANSFYEILPTPSAAHQADNMCDYAARALVPNFILADAYGPQQSDGWDWEKLRNINYFIQNCTDPRVSESVRMNYIGLARFFRAWFYFDKVKRFGDVPWINKAMEVDDPDLYAARDSRTLVMDSVLADLDFACEHITLTSDQTSSLITKYVAQAFKSRVCLFEGTFRKYHTEYGLKESANAWLNEAVKAAEDVIANSGFKLYTANGTTKSYRDLFISVKPVTTEVMLAAVCDKSLSVLNDANWYWTSATYGPRLNLIRTFVNTYLMEDGTPFTDKEGYKTMVFMDEVKNRDKRLQQTIRMGDYKRIDGGVQTPAPPIFSYTYTGYQPIKYCLDDVFYDSGANNDNSIPLIRFAEVLLNYAEALYEAYGNPDYTDNTFTLSPRAAIDKVRARAGMPGVASDDFLERIRNERRVELAFEDHRFWDVRRWKIAPQTMDIYGVKIEKQGDGLIYTRQLVDKRTWSDKMYLYPVSNEELFKNPLLKQNPDW